MTRQEKKQIKIATELIGALLADRPAHPVANVIRVVADYATTPAGRREFAGVTRNDAEEVGRACAGQVVLGRILRRRRFRRIAVHFPGQDAFARSREDCLDARSRNRSQGGDPGTTRKWQTATGPRSCGQGLGNYGKRQTFYQAKEGLSCCTAMRFRTPTGNGSKTFCRDAPVTRAGPPKTIDCLSTPCCGSDAEILQAVIERTLAAIHRHLNEPADEFNKWFMGGNNSFIAQIGRRKLLPGNRVSFAGRCLIWEFRHTRMSLGLAKTNESIHTGFIRDQACDPAAH